MNLLSVGKEQISYLLSVGELEPIEGEGERNQLFKVLYYIT